MGFVTKTYFIFLSKRLQDYISSVFSRKNRVSSFRHRTFFVLLRFHYKYHWYLQGPGPGMNMMLGPPGPLGSGKIYPPNQPMVFNPSNPNAPPIYPCGGCHKEVKLHHCVRENIRQVCYISYILQEYICSLTMFLLY